jgi:DNA or RNA helicases of superfamily II
MFFNLLRKDVFLITLREDQLLLVNKTLQNIKEDSLIVSPSGSGKSFILAYLEKFLTQRGYIVHVYAPTIEVRDQLNELMKLNGSNNKVKGIVTDLRNSNGIQPDYLLIDEAHHSEAESYQRLFEKYPDAIKIGFSATPERLDGKGLGNTYKNIIIGKQVKELIDEKILSNYKYYAPSNSDALTRLVSDKYLNVFGEHFFNDAQKSSSYKKTIYADVVKTWKEKGENKQTILFAPNIKMSKQFAKEFQKHGIVASHLDGSTSNSKRQEIIHKFRLGDIKLLCNVDIISEGFDMSDADCVILTRPTQSLALFMQQAFRAMRYREGKTAIILDHADNISLHGEIDRIYDWDLQGRAFRGADKQFERTIWDKWSENAVFDKSVELKEVVKDYDGRYDKLIEKAISLANIEGFKLLAKIEKEAKIRSVGNHSWAYAMTLKYGFNLASAKVREQ